MKQANFFKTQVIQLWVPAPIFSLDHGSLVLCGQTFLPPTESFSLLVCRDRGLPDPVPLTRMVGRRLASAFLHNAVLSVSLSMSNRMWPGTSLPAKSEGISGNMLRSDSETLELVSGQKTWRNVYQWGGSPHATTALSREAGRLESAHAQTQPLLEVSSTGDPRQPAELWPFM